MQELRMIKTHIALQEIYEVHTNNCEMCPLTINSSSTAQRYPHEGIKQTDSPLWSSLNLYNIFYDHLDMENIPFPYTGLCDVCEYECEGYIWIWSACQQCVSTKLWNLEIQVHIGHRKIHSTIKHSVHHRHHQSHELSHELNNIMHHHLQNGGGGGGLLWWWWNYEQRLKWTQTEYVKEE